MENNIIKLLIDNISNIYNESDTNHKIIISRETKKILDNIDDSFPNVDDLKRDIINAIGINRIVINTPTKFKYDNRMVEKGLELTKKDKDLKEIVKRLARK